MLSSTYSITDTKERLINDYSVFGLVSDAAYTTALTNSFNDIKLSKMYPIIGAATYAVIEAKNKVSLETYEELTYWAEVFYVCADFLEYIGSFNESSSSGATESLTVEGYSYSTSNDDILSGPKKSAEYWLSKANLSLIQAGYNINQLQKTSGIFGGENEL